MRQRRNLGLTAWSLHLQSQLSLSIEWMRGSLPIPRLMPCMSKSQSQCDGGKATLVVSLVSCCGRELKSWPHSAASEAIVWYEMGAHFASISSLYLEPHVLPQPSPLNHPSSSNACDAVRPDGTMARGISRVAYMKREGEPHVPCHIWRCASVPTLGAPRLLLPGICNQI